MSVEELMTQEVTLRRPAGETRDSIGEATLTYTSLSTTMYLEPGDGGRFGGKEEEAERNTPIGEWFGIGRANVDFSSWDQVIYGEHVLDIIAPPRLIPNPRLGTQSHWEINLREVT